MNFLNCFLSTVGSGTIAYYSAQLIRDPLTRPNIIAWYQLAESGSVKFLEALSQRATVECDTWLAEKLVKHAADENRHSQIFAHALKQLNKQIIDFKSLPWTTPERQLPEQRSPFFEDYYEGYSSDQFKASTADWMVFMASSYVLELDASKEFARMANVLPKDEQSSRNLKKGMLSIANDEASHAAYLHEAMMRRMPAADVQKLVDEWRNRKVKAMLAMLGALMQGSWKMPSLVQNGTSVETDEETRASASKLVLPAFIGKAS